MRHGAWTRPAPTRVRGNGNLLAVSSSFRHRFMPRRPGEVCAQSAAQPATCAVAMLVPLFVPYRVGRGTEEKTSRPGAAISIFPKAENDDGARFGSRDATDMMVGELAGVPVAVPEPPAAATMSSPLLSAALPAAVYAACTGDCAPSAIEMT